MVIATLLLVCAGCSARPSPALARTSKQGFAPEIPATWPVTAEGKHVLVLWNRPNPDGEKLALYYAAKRGVPRENVVRVIMDAGEDTNNVAFDQGIRAVVGPWIKESKTPIDYIVLAKGMPLRLFDATSFCYSLDAYIAAMDLDFAPMREPKREEVSRVANPYFGKSEPFSRAKFGFYLVTRLDGYSYEDAKRLVDQSIASKPEKGPFHFDAMGKMSNEGYEQMNRTLDEANEVMKKKGFEVDFDRTFTFTRPAGPVMGYCSWGSNDHAFVPDSYQAVRFKPGAIAETFVSTSARTLKPVTSGQSVITDLIAHGVTGVKGYVMEPYTLALARPNILFDRYTSGFNLAESFSMASPVLKWRDVVFGDPLCRPYKK